MKENSLSAIRTAFKIELNELQKIPELPDEGHWEYRRDASGSWGGRLVPKPSFMNLHRVRRYDEMATGIEEALKKNYITEKDVDSLKAWRKDPANWGLQTS